LTILAAEAAPLAFGGDGNITLPLLRATHRFYPDLVVLHVDAHTDTYRGDCNQDYMRYNVATTFTRAAEEGLIDTNGYCQTNLTVLRLFPNFSE
jgi:arginase family enzyme